MGGPLEARSSRKEPTSGWPSVLRGRSACSTNRGGGAQVRGDRVFGPPAKNEVFAPFAQPGRRTERSCGGAASFTRRFIGEVPAPALPRDRPPLIVRHVIQPLAFGIAIFALLGLMTAWRFGLFTRRFQSNALERFAADAGHRMSADRNGFSAVVEGLPILVRMAATPGHGAPRTTWTVSASAVEPVQGRLSVRPKHEDEPVGLRVGDLDFDTCFYVEGTSRDVVCRVLDDVTRRALFSFGPRGQSSYDHGAATMEWETHEPMTPDEIKLGIAVVHALCRSRR